MLAYANTEYLSDPALSVTWSISSSSSSVKTACTSDMYTAGFVCHCSWSHSICFFCIFFVCFEKNENTNLACKNGSTDIFLIHYNATLMIHRVCIYYVYL